MRYCVVFHTGIMMALQACALCTYLRFADLIKQTQWDTIDEQLAFYLKLSNDSSFLRHLLFLTEPVKEHLTCWKNPYETVP